MSKRAFDAWMRLRTEEKAAFAEHQRRIQVPDKDKRRRAVREYRTWLEYLVAVGRITQGEATEMEYCRIRNL